VAPEPALQAVKDNEPASRIASARPWLLLRRKSLSLERDGRCPST
jgi:hypothetical protein